MSWDRGGDDDRIEVKAAGFAGFDKSTRDEIVTEAECIATAVDVRDVDVRFVDDVVDLTEATRNRFLSPLSGP